MGMKSSSHEQQQFALNQYKVASPEIKRIVKELYPLRALDWTVVGDQITKIVGDRIFRNWEWSAIRLMLTHLPKSWAVENGIIELSINS
jgi:hypothetical protein